MKKILFAIVVCFGLATLMSSLVEGNNAFASNSVNVSVSMDNNYNFVGTFRFCFNGDGSTYNWDVYEASNACGLYYAKKDGQYYKLFSCDKDGYNYYLSYGGAKYYVKI